jgi:hypothetical protein
MKRQSIHLFVVAVMTLIGPLAQKGRGDFILYNDEQLTVNSSHSRGLLYDMSRAFIVLGGRVDYLYAYDSSTVGVSGGRVDYLYAYDSSTANISGGSMDRLYAYNSSTVGVSGGSVGYLYAHNSSTANISGGSVYFLYADNSRVVDISGGSVSGLSACDSSTVSISGGSVNSFCAYNSSTVNISGGSVNPLDASNSSVVDISGGTITNLNARDSSIVTFYGQNFRVGAGLTFDGERVLGTGILSGEWMDGKRWAVNITTNPPTATILAIPESEHRPFCVKYPRMDFNVDCKVDFADLAIMASSWLECNLVPESACWE